MSAMVIEARDLRAEHEQRLKTDPAYYQAYRDLVDEWAREISDSTLLELVREYRARRTAGHKTHPIELFDAVREYIRRNPEKSVKFPEVLLTGGGSIKGARSKRLSHPHMIDDSIRV